MGLVTYRVRKTHFSTLANDRGYVSGGRGRYPYYFYESHKFSSMDNDVEIEELFGFDPSERARFYIGTRKMRGLLLRRRK